MNLILLERLQGRIVPDLIDEYGRGTISLNQSVKINKECYYNLHKNITLKKLVIMPLDEDFSRNDVFEKFMVIKNKEHLEKNIIKIMMDSPQNTIIKDFKIGSLDCTQVSIYQKAHTGSFKRAHYEDGIYTHSTQDYDVRGDNRYHVYLFIKVDFK